MIHIVRKPFLCKRGQFEKGKKELCIGIALDALRGKEVYKFKLKNMPKEYQVSVNKVLAIGDEWTNKKKKQVIIIPLRICQ